MNTPEPLGGKSPESPGNAPTGRGRSPGSRKTQFGPGGVAPADKPLVVDENASLFDDMKFVRSHPKSMDTTEGHKDSRKWKDRNLSTFLAKFAELEKAANGAKPPEPATPLLYDGEGPCPACNRPPEAEKAGPEFLQDETKDIIWGQRLVEAAKARGETLPTDILGYTEETKNWTHEQFMGNAGAK